MSCLIQNFSQLTFHPRIAQVQREVDETTGIMRDNVRKAAENTDNLRNLEVKTGQLQTVFGSQVFRTLGKAALKPSHSSSQTL